MGKICCHLVAQSLVLTSDDMELSFRTDPKKLEENRITHIVSILSKTQYRKSDQSEKVKTSSVYVLNDLSKLLLDYRHVRTPCNRFERLTVPMLIIVWRI